MDNITRVIENEISRLHEEEGITDVEYYVQPIGEFTNETHTTNKGLTSLLAHNAGNQVQLSPPRHEMRTIKTKQPRYYQLFVLGENSEYIINMIYYSLMEEEIVAESAFTFSRNDIKALCPRRQSA